MAAVQKLTLRCLFEDETTATFTIDGINPQTGVVADLKAQIIAFNNARGGELSTKMKSKNGFNWIGINRAVLTTTDRQYIF